MIRPMAQASPEGTLDVFLQPGEWYFGDSKTCIRTTLGSCVAVVLWHPQQRLGGMCHYMLPSRGTRREEPLSGRYGDEALQLLFDAVRLAGTQLGDYEFKLFGGAKMFAGGASCPLGVSARNVDFALTALYRHGLAIKAQSLGCVGYRQLIFDLGSGAGWMRRGSRQLRLDKAQITVDAEGF